MASNEFLNLYKELKSTEFGSWFQQLINLSLKNKERAELLLKRLMTSGARCSQFKELITVNTYQTKNDFVTIN